MSYFPSDPKKIDKLLKEDWGYGILNFAHVLAEILTENAWDDYPYGKKSSIIKAIDKPEQIKKNVLFDLRSFLNTCPQSLLLRWGEMKTEKEKVDYLIRVFKLKPFFERLHWLDAPLKSSLEYMGGNLRGRRITKKNKIGSIWALAMKNSWQDIVGLLRWFYLKLKDTAYGNEIEIREKNKKDKKNLKIQCLYSIKNHQNLVENLFRLFFFESSLNKKIYNFHSIKFKENSVEICRPFDRHQYIEKMEFRGDKKTHSSYWVEPTFSKKPQYISFPKDIKFP